MILVLKQPCRFGSFHAYCSRDDSLRASEEIPCLGLGRRGRRQGTRFRGNFVAFQDGTGREVWLDDDSSRQLIALVAPAK